MTQQEEKAKRRDNWIQWGIIGLLVPTLAFVWDQSVTVAVYERTIEQRIQYEVGEALKDFENGLQDKYPFNEEWKNRIINLERCQTNLRVDAPCQ